MISSRLVRNAGRDTKATVPAPVPTPSITRHIAGLDGLRAIAVVAVIFFHADLYWARGGYLGVDLFFVLSGFLITGLLADEIQQSGRLNVGRFYWRRAKRLLPAVWLMMVCVTFAAAIIATDALPRLRGDTLASLAYLTNWELLSVHVSYFDSTGRQPLLQHLWSLAIEEQFYIVWAILVPLGLALVGRRALAVVAGSLAIASATWMAVLAAKIGYPGHGDPSRLYFGTDTHGFPLLLGAALGLAWQPGRASRTLRAVPRVVGVVVGVVALALLLALFARLGEESTALYPWGLLLADVTSMAVIAMASHPGLAFGQWLDCKPLRWIGQRSYGIYLWHWPIFMLTRPGIDLRMLDVHAALALRVALTIGIAALSYRYVEMPIRQGALERMRSDLRVATSRRRVVRRATALAMIVLLGFGVTAEVLSRAPTAAEPAQDVREALHLDPVSSDRISGRGAVDPVLDPSGADAIGSGLHGAAATGAGPKHVRSRYGTPLSPAETAAINLPTPAEQSDLPVEPMQPDPPTVDTYTGDKLTAVGDSVLLGSSQLLEGTLHGTDVHATVGSQAADVLTQVKALHDSGTLRLVVVVHLGTNGYVYEDQLRQILTTLKDAKRVILVNTHVPRRWMESNNLMIDRVAPDFPNVVVARWSDVSEGQPDYFVSDGVHLTDRGQRAFIANIMRAGHLVSDPARVADKVPLEKLSNDKVTLGKASVVEAPLGKESIGKEAIGKTPPEKESIGKASHDRNWVDPDRDYATGAGDLSPTLVLAERAAAPDKYWQQMALCETDANWHNPGAQSGGLAIAQDDWKAWGGLDLAKTPAEATPAQQIEVANRISTAGWTPPDGAEVKPVGFGRWRCVAALPPPAAHPDDDATPVYTPESVIAQSFHLGERGQVVSDLQILLGAPRDGIYSKATHKRHVAYLKTNGLPEDRAGAD